MKVKEEKMKSRKVYSTAEAARLFQVSQQSVRKWCQSGKIKARNTPGGFYKIEYSEIERFRQEFNMPDLDLRKCVLIVEEDQKKIDFISGLLVLLDLEVVTASNLIDIGIAVGNLKPMFIISGTDIKLKTNDLLSNLSASNKTKDIPILIILKEGQYIDLPKDRRKIITLIEPIDVYKFKSVVKMLIK